MPGSSRTSSTGVAARWDAVRLAATPSVATDCDRKLLGIVSPYASLLSLPGAGR